MTDVAEQLADLRRRINRIEATLEEMARASSVFTNDRSYDEKERLK